MKKEYAVITGASSGIGAHFAKTLAKEGYPLVLVARRETRLQELAKELNTECQIIACDLSQIDECKRLIGELENIPYSVFINNAGFGDCGAFLGTSVHKELEMVDVNIKALHFLMKEVLQYMEKKNGGYILNVASSAGLIPAGPYMATYYATKAYVVSLTSAVAEELRESGSKVYVGCLCPGPVDTEFNQVANVEFALPGISAEYCVNYAVKKMFQRKTVIVPTWYMKLAVTFGRFLPRKLYIRITSRQQKKKFYGVKK